MRWFADDLTGDILRRQGLSFDVVEIPITKIDMKLSRQNHAREIPLHIPTVDNYAAAMARNERFPAIVVVPRGDKYVIAGGNHRTEAAIKNGYETILAYVCKSCDSHEFDILCKSLNSRLGCATPVGLLVKQAVGLIRERAVPIKDAAARLNVSVDQIRCELGAQNAEQIGLDAGVETKWGRTQLCELSRIKLDTVILHTLKTCKNIKPTVDQAKALKASVNVCKSQSEMIAAVDKWRSEFTVDASRRTASRPNRRDITHATSLLNRTLGICKTFDSMQMTPEEVKATIKTLKAITSTMSQLMASGSR